MAMPRVLGTLSLLVLSLLADVATARDAGDFLAGKALQSKHGDVSVVATRPEELTTVRYTHETYGDQIKNAFSDLIFGMLLVVLGFPVLYYNEKREAHMDKIFAYGEKIVKTNVPSGSVDGNYEANLTHMQGVTACDEILRDDDFGIGLTNCAKLSKEVEMFQWQEQSSVEERDTPGGGKDKITTYTYSRGWSSEPVDSSSFQEVGGHENPPFPFQGRQDVATKVGFGAFQLTPSLIGQMNNFQPLADGEQPPSLNRAGRVFQLKAGIYETFSGTPQIGDMRVTFRKVPCGPATVLAVQHEDSFVPLTYDMVPQSSCPCLVSVPEKVELPQGASGSLLNKGASPSGAFMLCQCVGMCIEAGESLNDLATETLSAADMFTRAKNTQACIRKSLKLCGYLLFFFGLFMQFKFVPTFFRIIPFIGTWIQFFGNMFAYLGAFFIANFLWCFTVAIAWLAFRPAKGVLLIAASIAMIAVPTYLANKFD
mmetsp:Transcript_62504/g.174216  ORF Transcript_62504/g.174216 Transcript_62504/m.174216 type:complete len:483 (+) Transcript_62504:97-1545(+)